jgi:mannosidase alpha-like ER degradation enhancer 1
MRDPAAGAGAMSPAQRRDAAASVKRMFYHGYDSYMKYAFPHDELKPISKTYTDSLGELGNLNREHLSKHYSGIALTLIDSMSTLAVLGNTSEFRKNVRWLETNLNFDIDVRVNAFECNIRVLGGLLSTHLVAEGDGGGGGREISGSAVGGSVGGSGGNRGGSDRGGGGGEGGGSRGFRSMGKPFMPSYKGGILRHAEDLGRRLLKAFDTPTGMPYAWVNLKTGVRPGEVTETNVAAVGSFILEFAMLSRLTAGGGEA